MNKRVATLGHIAFRNGKLMYQETTKLNKILRSITR